MLDMADSIVPKSDQMNSDDLIPGARTFTITEVRKTGGDDQPISVYLAEFLPDRPFKPSKSMRRVMVAAWGRDGSTYVGKRLTLYRDPGVKWAGQPVGGIRISHMSGLTEPMKLALTETKGKRAAYVVQPLPDAPAPAQGRADGITPEQSRELGSLLREAAITDKEAGLAYIGSVIDREVASTKDLTADEATRVIADLKALDGPGE